MLANTNQTYGIVAQVLHWVTALLILLLLVLGIYMHELPVDTAQQVEEKIWLYSLHKTLGILTFGVAIVRVVWAVVQTRPFPINSDKKLESTLASVIHWLLYGCIILMPITGWLHHAALEGFAPIWWPWSQDIPFVPKDPHLAKLFGNAHFLTAVLLMGSLFLHIAGAAKHVIVDRDQTLARMTPGKVVKFERPLPQPGKGRIYLVLVALVFTGLIVAIFSSQTPVIQNASSITESGVSSTGKWIVDHSKSKLEVEIIQGGKPVAGSFSNWQAEIEFDPDKLEKANVAVSISIASLSLGGVTEQAISKDFLNAAGYPQAEFSSKKFIKIEDGKYQAEGELSLIGETNPLVLPFDLKIENGRAFMSGRTKIERLDYGIGQKGFSTDGTLGFTVQIMVNLEAELN